MAKKGKKKIKLQPLEDRVVVKRLEADEKTAGGIVLPDTAKEKPQRAEVLAVGPGKTTESGERAAMQLAVGDSVLIGKYSGTEITVEGEECVFIREDDVLAILE